MHTYICTYIYIKLFTYIYKNTKRLIYSELNTYKYLYTHKKSPDTMHTGLGIQLLLLQKTL